MNRSGIRAALLLSCCLMASSSRSEQDSAELRFYETKIRPLLAEHCYECHGPKLQESELRLDTTEGTLGGGASGLAVVAGSPEESLILVALSYREDDLQMPPNGKLEDHAIADIRRWIEQGAAMPPATGAVLPRRGAIDMDEARQFWAIQPPHQAPLPDVRDPAWPRSPLDYFIASKLDAHGLEPAPTADRRILLRRVTIDLLGVPPTPEEVVDFLPDDRPDAYARVVDRLLSSPQYGERWARHWLDVARYADSNGLDENIAHGNAWRYRDYVIAAMNADKPFDQFVREQLAGDLLPTEHESARLEHLTATGFLVLGPKVLAEGDERKMEVDIVDEQIDTMGRTFLGLTLGCARCHDHKFDPIRTEDYYALAGIFESTRTMESFKRIAKWNENSVATVEQLALKSAHDEKIASHKAMIQQVTQAAHEQLKTQLGAGAAIPKDAEAHFPAETQQKLKTLREELVGLEKSVPVLPTAMGVAEATPKNTRVHLRGSHLSLGKEVERGVPLVLAYDDQPQIGPDRSGRLELAHWLVRPEHPLTSRVIVNRAWRWHFGRGLVGSTDNFGQLGERPINQPLLDWLAVDLVRNDWSLKHLHRSIVLSSTYQMSSAHNESATQVDPENHWQWRANLRRLEAEAIRDSLLAVSGLLDQKAGGSMLHVGNREFLFDHTSKDSTNYETTRRSIYLPVIRNHLYDIFPLFDYSDASVPNGDRATSTIAPQALFLMNSDLLQRTAEALATRLLSEEPESSAARVERLYQLAYSRSPTDEEIAQSHEFLAEVTRDLEASASDASTSAKQSWEALCQVVLASSEFLYLR